MTFPSAPPFTLRCLLGASLGLGLYACAATTPAPGNAGGRGDPDESSASDGATAPETSARTQPDANKCPATFQEAQRPRQCAFAVTSACTYKEGACGCEAVQNCGGAQMRPTGAGEPGTWRCGSTDPRLLDVAGCPYVPPAAGASCASAGKYCFYGACSWAGTAATCSAGAWHLAQIMGPPPP